MKVLDGILDARAWKVEGEGGRKEKILHFELRFLSLYYGVDCSEEVLAERFCFMVYSSHTGHQVLTCHLAQKYHGTTNTFIRVNISEFSSMYAYESHMLCS